MDRSGNPTDAAEAFFRKMGRVAYPTPEEKQEWERIHRKNYYNNDPIDDPAQTPLVKTALVPQTPLVPLPFEERMEATFAPSVNMLALKINGVDRKEHLAIFEWVTERLKLKIDI